MVTDLGNEMCDDVGGTIISHILTIDCDGMGKGLGVVL